VSAAFHTPLMQSAVDGMAEILKTITFRDPVTAVVGNTTAEPMTSGRELKDELLRQLCHGVQWQRSVEYMLGEGVTNFIEIGPGEVLSGLIKRISGDASAVSIGDLPTVNSLFDGVDS
jgi:[acyl-carrier-protein] S-malonyltransferase